jgi:putative transposase
MDWARILAYVTRDGGSRTAGAERISGRRKPHLKNQLNGRLKLSAAERAMLGEIGHRLGRKALAEVSTVSERDETENCYIAQNRSRGSRRATL